MIGSRTAAVVIVVVENIFIEKKNKIITKVNIVLLRFCSRMEKQTIKAYLAPLVPESNMISLRLVVIKPQKK